ncbi:hypothetical protein [Streptomyces sp. NBC_01190]|uniref:hypothetical protein n=1 Tax=Streptomyces sp. NBC_01190 TaxID=2903767 RepID=UPI00386E1C27
MARASQASEKAALIYQRSPLERQKKVAARLDALVRAERQDEGDGGLAGAEVVRPA